LTQAAVMSRIADHGEFNWPARNRRLNLPHGRQDFEHPGAYRRFRR
jgi:hypothetical protein